MRLTLVTLVAVFASAANSAAQDKVTVYKGARILPAGAAAIDGGVLIVQNGKIQSVGGASTPLPAEKTTPAAAATATPPSPDLGAQRTSAARLGMPVDGKIIRPYQKKKNEGIDIGAAAGTPVKAAGDGTVAAITKDTDQVPILVIRHDGNLLTVYANIDGIKVAKGDKVKRGQPIAVVRNANPAFVHFEVREGLESTDPVPYLK